MKSKLFTKNNKVLFIIHDVYQNNNQFPLGPAYLTAILHNHGASVEAYCMDIFHYTNEKLAEHLQKNEYDLIGVGFLAARFKETVIDLCKVVNENKKNAWLVLGGHGPSPIPEYMLRKTKADIVAIGEAENTIVDLLKCKITKGNLSKVNGIAYLENNEFRKTGPNKIVNNLDEIPFPLWDIFPINKYATCRQKLPRQKPGEKTFEILTSRGCVNRCNFCYRMEKGIRLRNIPNIIEEFKILSKKYGISYYLFQDELFVLNKKRVFEFEDALKEANLKIKFAANARVDIIDEEMVEILKRCGCALINFGFESSDDSVLKIMNKNTTVEQNIKALEMVKKAGVGMGLNFIWNNLGDNEETLKRNAALIKKYNTYDQCRTIRPVAPYPGCDLYYKLIEMGKLKGPEDFFEKFKNSDLMSVNLMNIPDKRAYELLLEVNSDLIIDHYKHTNGNIESAKQLIQQFADLYSGKTTQFRGAKYYDYNVQAPKK